MVQLASGPLGFNFKKYPRCPLCGESWSSRKRCDPQTPDWTIERALSNLFANRIEKVCPGCKQPFNTISQFKKYCTEECRRESVDPDEQRAGWRERRARWRENNQVEKKCEYDGKLFSTHKPEQRFCSLSCSNRNRYARS